MNTVYVVTPLALLAASAGYLVPATARLDEALAAEAIAAEQRRIDERRVHDEARERAAHEHRTRVAEQLRVRAEQERAAQEAQNQRDQTLADSLTDAQADREALRREIIALESRLHQLGIARDHDAAALHAARAALETRRIERRNADLELQRMILLLAETIDANIVTGPPLFPSPAAP